jgi:hypothetical protein
VDLSEFKSLFLLLAKPAGTNSSSSSSIDGADDDGGSSGSPSESTKMAKKKRFTPNFEMVTEKAGSGGGSGGGGSGLAAAVPDRPNLSTSNKKTSKEKAATAAAAATTTKKKTNFAPLLPLHWKGQVEEWVKDDCPSLDIGGLVVGDKQEEALLYGKSDGVLAGVPFFNHVFQHLGCRVEWRVEEGDVIAASKAKDGKVIAQNHNKWMRGTLF